MESIIHDHSRDLAVVNLLSLPISLPPVAIKDELRRWSALAALPNTCPSNRGKLRLRRDLL